MKLYHVSYIKNRESILNEGLKPFSSENEYFKYENRICFSNIYGKYGFDFVDYDNVDVYEVIIPDELIHLVKQDDNLIGIDRYVCIDFPDDTYRLTNLRIIQTREDGVITKY